ncbi:MAG: hypothetical protein QXD48_00125 [Candidatus Aenigmatarchaeota archaeon]
MRKLLLFVLFLLIANVVFAFEISAPEGTIDIGTGSTKIININLTSNKDDDITFSFVDGKTWINLDVQKIKINAGEIKTVKVYISPFFTTQFGLYKIGIVAESTISKETKKADIFINVKRGEYIYIDKVTVSGNLEPKGYAKIETTIKNYKLKTVNDIYVHTIVSSPLRKLLDTTIKIDKLDPDESKTIENIINFDRLAEPGTYNVKIISEYMNEKNEYEQTFAVIKKSVITKQYEKFPLLLGYGKTIRVRNDGNEVGDEIVYDDVPKFDSIFFYGDEPTQKEDGRYAWKIKDIKPDEEKTITYYIDYSPLFVFVLAIIIVFWFFFYKYRTVRISKFILNKKHIEEGEEFTVCINVYNGLKKLDEILVHDFVPSIFKIKDTEGPVPHKKTTNIGTELTWKLKDVKSHETRILTYKIIPIFGVHGTIRLPEASAEFKFGKKFVKNISGSPSIGLVESEETKIKLLRSKFISRK